VAKSLAQFEDYTRARDFAKFHRQQAMGFKSKIQHSDADYFNLSGKDVAIAQARREKTAPTIVLVERVLRSMPVATELERRDRALIAFAAITSARGNALASFRLGHVNLAGGCIEQDARTVRTKFGKTLIQENRPWQPRCA
jgi:hypothetical protein